MMVIMGIFVMKDSTSTLEAKHFTKKNSIDQFGIGWFKAIS